MWLVCSRLKFGRVAVFLWGLWEWFACVSGWVVCGSRWRGWQRAVLCMRVCLRLTGLGVAADCVRVRRA